MRGASSAAILAAAAITGAAPAVSGERKPVVLVRDGRAVRVYLNGQLDLEAKVAAGACRDLEECFFGGRSDNDSNWEGRLDEIAAFDRALTPEEVARLTVK